MDFKYIDPINNLKNYNFEIKFNKLAKHFKNNRLRIKNCIKRISGLFIQSQDDTQAKAIVEPIYGFV